MKSDNRKFKDNSKYCEYHRDTGHHTNECKTLVVAIKQIESNDKSSIGTFSQLNTSNGRGTVLTIMEGETIKRKADTVYHIKIRNTNLENP